MTTFLIGFCVFIYVAVGEFIAYGMKLTSREIKSQCGQQDTMCENRLFWVFWWLPVLLFTFMVNPRGFCRAFSLGIENNKT
ncbi:MAG TPA: hypothetical protein VN843_06785 [Anaerolineales bacterium]|nr:hypothetical protein [Anaerolineales bacterium]